jgi:hypothetical protein
MWSSKIYVKYNYSWHGYQSWDNGLYSNDTGGYFYSTHDDCSQNDPGLTRAGANITISCVQQYKSIPTGVINVVFVFTENQNY